MKELNKDKQNITSRVEEYLHKQSKLDTLRFISCGSVDDGKSTLIGRMLYEAQLLFEDQVSSLQADSKKSGTQGEDIDFALLVDGLSAEREQGITIDVAYRFFATDRRKFIVADTPGHEQYTRNMFTGASTADLAIILIDATQGILDQTRRHSFIVSLLGIKHIILAVNKMDLVDYSHECFQNICDEYTSLSKNFEFESITPIPLSALKGDNVVQNLNNMKWYQGPTLMTFLETVDISEGSKNGFFRLPVQLVNRPNSDFRGYSGTIISGNVSVGDKVKLLPSGKNATINRIILASQELENAICGQAITVTLDKEIDLSRGDLITSHENPCEVSNLFESDLVWIDNESGYIGRKYIIRLGTSQINASLTDIKFKYDINDFKEKPGRKLNQNDIARVQITLDNEIGFEAYKDCSGMGAFVLIDKYTNATAAAGMVRFSLRRANNIHRQNLDINRSDREKLAGHQAKVIWLTGISGSGKSTIANAAEKLLYQRGYRTYILDGDNIRHGLSKDLGFTEADRVENIRRISEVSKLMLDAGIIVITAFISPYRSERDMAKNLFDDGNFKEVFIDTPLKIAEERDPKGLYKKARNGKIPNFTGIDSPYEAPLNPDLVINAATQSIEDCARSLVTMILSDK